MTHSINASQRVAVTCGPVTHTHTHTHTRTHTGLEWSQRTVRNDCTFTWLTDLI